MPDSPVTAEPRDRRRGPPPVAPTGATIHLDTRTADLLATARAGLLAEVTRRDERSGTEIVESVHLGHLVVVHRPTRGEVEVVGAVGADDASIFVRSLAKPLQALSCLDLLGNPALPSEQLAVAWASHRGEPRHLAAVDALLERAGTVAQDLTCPPAVAPAEPGATPSRRQHNCSGKHALFAWAGRELGLRGPELLDPDAALQQRILADLDVRLGIDALGVDGCGAPAVGARLDRVATAYAALAVDLDTEPVREAGFEAPGLVGGEGRLESALLAAGVVAKVGAEGSYGVGWRGSDGAGWGLAAKALDGSQRGSAAAAVAVLVDAGIVPDGTWTPPPALGGGEPVGQVRASADVRAVAELIR